MYFAPYVSPTDIEATIARLVLLSAPQQQQQKPHQQQQQSYGAASPTHQPSLPEGRWSHADGTACYILNQQTFWRDLFGGFSPSAICSSSTISAMDGGGGGGGGASASSSAASASPALSLAAAGTLQRTTLPPSLLRGVIPSQGGNGKVGEWGRRPKRAREGPSPDECIVDADADDDDCGAASSGDPAGDGDVHVCTELTAGKIAAAAAAEVDARHDDAHIETAHSSFSSSSPPLSPHRPSTFSDFLASLHPQMRRRVQQLRQEERQRYGAVRSGGGAPFGVPRHLLAMDGEGGGGNRRGGLDRSHDRPFGDNGNVDGEEVIRPDADDPFAFASSAPPPIGSFGIATIGSRATHSTSSSSSSSSSIADIFSGRIRGVGMVSASSSSSSTPTDAVAAAMEGVGSPAAWAALACSTASAVAATAESLTLDAGAVERLLSKKLRRAGASSLAASLAASEGPGGAGFTSSASSSFVGGGASAYGASVDDAEEEDDEGGVEGLSNSDDQCLTDGGLDADIYRFLGIGGGGGGGSGIRRRQQQQQQVAAGHTASEESEFSEASLRQRVAAEEEEAMAVAAAEAAAAERAHLKRVAEKVRRLFDDPLASLDDDATVEGENGNDGAGSFFSYRPRYAPLSDRLRSFVAATNGADCVASPDGLAADGRLQQQRRRKAGRRITFNDEHHGGALETVSPAELFFPPKIPGFTSRFR